MAQPGTTTAGNERLEFSDAASCAAWLERLPAANPVNGAQRHAIVADQALKLLSTDVPATARLELLELLHETVVKVQGELAKKYLGRPVPLDDDERAVWNQVVALWRSMAAGYDALIDAMAGAAPELAGEAALICQRALRYVGLAIAEHSRIYCNVPPALWRDLHRLYVFAETAGAATDAVSDPAGRTIANTSCAGTYVHTLLAQLAQPDALSGEQMAAVGHGLERWEALVSLSATPIAGSAIPAIAVDLASDKGAGLAQDMPAGDARHLALENLGKALRQAGAALKQGQKPAQVGLPGLASDAAEKLLMLLHIQWCAAGTGRMDERTPGGIVVTISPNLAAIHYQVTGKAFKQPGGEMTARERQSRDMMGLISEASDRALVSQRSASVETWVIVNKSASGFLGMCHDPNAATHIAHNQLLGLRNPSNKQMYVGTVQRLIVDNSGAIWVGLRLITGLPQAVAARMPDARGPDAGKFDRALLIAEDAARKVPASIILMPGWYAGNRQLDLQTDRPQPQKIKLLALLDKGPNFERATYVAA